MICVTKIVCDVAREFAAWRLPLSRADLGLLRRRRTRRELRRVPRAACARRGQVRSLHPDAGFDACGRVARPLNTENDSLRSVARGWRSARAYMTPGVTQAPPAVQRDQRLTSAPSQAPPASTQAPDTWV